MQQRSMVRLSVARAAAADASLTNFFFTKHRRIRASVHRTVWRHVRRKWFHQYRERRDGLWAPGRPLWARHIVRERCVRRRTRRRSGRRCRSLNPRHLFHRLVQLCYESLRLQIDDGRRELQGEQGLMRPNRRFVDQNVLPDLRCHLSADPTRGLLLRRRSREVLPFRQVVRQFEMRLAESILV